MQYHAISPGWEICEYFRQSVRINDIGRRDNVRRIRDFALGAFGLFLGLGFVPIWASGGVALALGYNQVAEYIVIFGNVVWIAARTGVGWHLSREWRKSEELRIKEGREGPAEIRRREKREAERRRNKERMREVTRLMRLIESDGGKRSQRQLTKAALSEFHDIYRWDQTADGGMGSWVRKKERANG